MARVAPPEPMAPPRDSSTAPNRLPIPDPSNIGLPRSRSSFMLPAALAALVAFVLVMAAHFIWG